MWSMEEEGEQLWWCMQSSFCFCYCFIISCCLFHYKKILQTSIHDVQFIISWHDWCLVLWALCLRLMCSFDKFRPNNYREACICHMWKFIWSIIVLNVLHCCIAKYTLFKNSLKEWFKYIKQLLDLIFSELEHEKM